MSEDVQGVLADNEAPRVLNHIERMVAKLCPRGVEYVKVGDIADIGTGSSDRKDAVPDGEYPFYVRSREVLRSVSYLFDEESVIIPGEGGIGEIFHFVSGKYNLHQRAYRVSFRVDYINTKFAYYYFAANFKKFILAKSVNATVKSIRKPMVQSFQIPVPPLEVQNAIVEILDKFTKLEAELAARRAQYEYYRNLLYENLIDQVPKLELGKFATLNRGHGMPKSDFVETGVGAIHYGQIYTKYGFSANSTLAYVSEESARRLTKVSPGDLVVTNTSENINDVCKAVAWIGDEDIVTGGHSTVVTQHFQNPKYLSYYFSTDKFNFDKKKYAFGTKVIDVSPKNLAKIKIPLPPLAEQERIVKILDKFDVLVNDISSGLPAEIEARRKQYEYYRDRLLTFPRKFEPAEQAMQR